MPGEPWRLIRTWDAPPGFNMALDEALLRSPDPRPTLRLYTWEPEAVSLGYFQRYAEVAAVAGDLPLVRRLTGGGAIHHARELTFSIAAPLGVGLYAGEVRESYVRVHGVIAAVLAQFGSQASVRGDVQVRSDRAASPMCFHHSTAIDLVWGARKGVGSAQRRTGGRVLHHGSIKLGTTELEGEIATVGEVSAQEVGVRLAEAVGHAAGGELEAAVPLEAELLHARAREGYFASASFLQRR